MGIATGEKARQEIEALFKFDEFLGGGKNNSNEETDKIINSSIDSQDGGKEQNQSGKNNPTNDNSDSNGNSGDVESDTKTAQETVDDFKKTFAGLNPSVVIGLFDIIVSRGFAMGTKIGGIECSYKDYALDEKEKKFLAPFVEVVVMDYIRTLKPRDVLIVALVIIYGSKTFDVVANGKKIVKRKKTVDANAKNESDNSDNQEIKYNKDGSVAKKRGRKPLYENRNSAE